MKKILFIILEGASASGICVENVIKELINRGYSIDVLTYSTSKINDIHGVTNYQIPPKFLIKTKLHAIQCLLTSIIMWPWNSPIYTYRLYRYIYDLYINNKYDMMIPCYTQIDPLIAVNRLKNKFCDLKYVSYFLDSLSGGPKPRLLSEDNKIQKGLFWENKLLENADGIIMMQSSKKHHLKFSSGRAYFVKIQFLDIPMLLIEEQQKTEKKLDTNNIKITYVGSMPLSVRKPYYGLEMLANYKNVSVNIVGTIPSDNQYTDFCRRINNVELSGSVDHLKAIEYMKDADVLLNFGNTVAQMVPSKIFEYISQGKPIISFSPNRNDPSIYYLKKYNNACIIIETEERKNNEIKLKKFINQLKVDNVSTKDLKGIFWNNTPESFGDYIETL